MDPAAHQWMREQLLQWQSANRKSITESPYANEWYYDKRVEAIDAGLLTKMHSNDVVKSYLNNSVLKKIRAEAKAKENDSLDVN